MHRVFPDGDVREFQVKPPVSRWKLLQNRRQWPGPRSATQWHSAVAECHYGSALRRMQDQSDTSDEFDSQIQRWCVLSSGEQVPPWMRRDRLLQNQLELTSSSAGAENPHVFDPPTDTRRGQDCELQNAPCSTRIRSI